MDGSDFEFDTRAIHAGQRPDPATGAVMPPIYATSTYAHDTPGEHRGYSYARSENPTRAALEANVASLEGGAHGRAFASGMAAIDAACSLVSPGDHVVTGSGVYGGTHRLFDQIYRGRGLDFSYVDLTDVGAIEAAFRDKTAMLWLETPTNPLLDIVDLSAAADVAADHGALCVVDNTFATPYLQRPLDHGAEVVCHSLTKYLGGHSDVVAGALVTDDPELDEQFGFYQNAVGGVPGPFDCFLVLRGTKTLPVRMDRHCENAGSLARWLDDHPAVESVYYPGLENHPGHDLASRQMDGFGGMLSVELDATLEEARAVASGVEVFTLGESLGGVESLIGQPAIMSHEDVDREARLEAGIADGLLRLSVGTESVNDLRADLDRAIAAVLG